MEGEPIGFVWGVEDLAKLPNGALFAKGIFVDGQGGFAIQGTENVVKWVAVKGDVEDWSIYYQPPHLGMLAKDFNWIVRNGDKLHHPTWINQLVPSTPQMMGLYRH